MKDSKTKNDILHRFIEELNRNRKSYNRVLTNDEKKFIDSDSFGYLLKLYQMGTINGDKMEKIIEASIYIAMLDNRKISLPKIKQLANILIHYDNSIVISKELAHIINELDDDAMEDETTH